MEGGGTLPDTPAAVSLMAAADSAVIPLEPFEESQCSTAEPGTCAITIKRYHRHSSTRARPTGGRHVARPLPSSCYCLVFIYAPSPCQSAAPPHRPRPTSVRHCRRDAGDALFTHPSSLPSLSLLLIAVCPSPLSCYDIILGLSSSRSPHF